jgi:hypothetical protein
MNNAHSRFGWLTYAKVTERTTTNFKLRLDRFIGEVLPDPPRQAKAHLVSVVGGDTQIAAISAAISLGDKFIVEAPGVPPVRICLERNAECYKGALLLSDRKKPLRHLIGISEELSSATSGNAGRTLLAASNPEFLWTSLAHIHGLPGIPDWAQWFHRQLTVRHALRPLLGIGCEPVLVRGQKQQFLDWMREGIETGELRFPEKCGPVQWPNLNLSHILQQPSALV